MASFGGEVGGCENVRQAPNAEKKLSELTACLEFPQECKEGNHIEGQIGNATKKNKGFHLGGNGYGDSKPRCPRKIAKRGNMRKTVMGLTIRGVRSLKKDRVLKR